jgi:hypothetical protein
MASELLHTAPLVQKLARVLRGLAMRLNGPCREGEEPTPAMYGGEKSDRAIDHP